MATVILARHGRTQANANGTLAGRSKGVRLDERGLEQARAAATRLDGLPIAAVVSSPLERCRDTAKLLAEGRELAVQADRGLLECDYGEWTGQQIKDLVKQPLWKTVQASPSAARFPGGESMAAMSARAVATVRERDAVIEREAGPDAVWVAVSHGDVIKAILADALGMHLDCFQRIVVDPASLSVVRYTPQRAFVVTMNSSSGALVHLAPPKRKRRRRTVPAGDAVVGGGSGPEVESA